MQIKIFLHTTVWAFLHKCWWPSTLHNLMSPFTAIHKKSLIHTCGKNGPLHLTRTSYPIYLTQRAPKYTTAHYKWWALPTNLTLHASLKSSLTLVPLLPAASNDFKNKHVNHWMLRECVYACWVISTTLNWLFIITRTLNYTVHLMILLPTLLLIQVMC